MGWQKLTAVFILCFWSVLSIAQITFPKNGVYDEQEGHYAFTNATIYISPDQKVEKATLLIKKGKVIAVGTDVGRLCTSFVEKIHYSDFRKTLSTLT